MVAARSPGPPRYRTSRSEPGRARQPEEHAEPLASDTVPESELQLPAAAAVNSLVAPLPREALASLVALVFPLRSAPFWISWFCVRFLCHEIFSSPISVWAWACGAALISVKLWVRVFRGASDLVFSPLRLLILLLEWRWPFRFASQMLDASSLICALLFLPRGWEIFWVSATMRRASRLDRIDRGGFLVRH